MKIIFIDSLIPNHLGLCSRLKNTLFCINTLPLESLVLLVEYSKNINSLIDYVSLGLNTLYLLTWFICFVLFLLAKGPRKPKLQTSTEKIVFINTELCYSPNTISIAKMSYLLGINKWDILASTEIWSQVSDLEKCTKCGMLNLIYSWISLHLCSCTGLGKTQSHRSWPVLRAMKTPFP